MISTFTASDTSHPLIKYLMLPDSERANAVTPMAELCAMARAELADPKQTFSFSLHDTNSLLDARPGARNLLARFLDFMWDKTQSGDARVDMRMTVSDTAFVQLLDKNEEGVGKGRGKSEIGEKPEREENASKATVGLCELKRLYAEVGGGSSKVAL